MNLKTGSSKQLLRQIGEHLVCAELGKKGFFATPFAGNVLDFDLLIADDFGSSMPIQVKTIKGISWQFDARKFLDFEPIENDVQAIKNKKSLTHSNLICVFVSLDHSCGDEKYFIFYLKELQEIIFKGYKEYLSKHSGKKPKNPNSFHVAVYPYHLEIFKDRWKLIEQEIQRLKSK